ncbi:hypothetical protein [Vibrio sp. HN007]|uniref:hypothetical protein n=1 Tax=Vibrio iocasae TaxID=3098914 RepID=UPI0035D4A299
MSIWVKLAVLSLVALTGYTLPFVAPTKVKFANQSAPGDIEKCNWRGEKCVSKNYELTLYSGNFSPLEQTVFGLSQKIASVQKNRLFVTSDDQRFGVIEAQQLNTDLYRILIPFCSNAEMKIIILIDKDTAIMLPKNSTIR